MFSRPGRLTLDYLNGKRVRYISPFRLYVIISAIYFFVLATHVANMATINSQELVGTSDWEQEANGISKFVTMSAKERADLEAQLRDPNNKLGSIAREELIKVSKMSSQRISYELINAFAKIMFLLLPLFAFLLKLLYIRRKRLYFDHFVFAVHMHSQVFVLLLLALCVLIAFPMSALGSLAYLTAFVYALLAMKKVYGQGWIKTVIKMFLLLFTYSIIVGLGVVASLLIGVLMARA